MFDSKVIADTYICLETFERGLNLCGYAPMLGTLSACIRKIYSVVEIIAGLAACIFAKGLHSQGDPKFRIALSVGGVLCGHGVLNFFRCYFEFIPFVPLVTTLPYDVFSNWYLGRRMFSFIH